MTAPHNPGPYPPPPTAGGPPGYGPAAPPKTKWLVPTLIGVAAVLVLCCGGPVLLGTIVGEEKPDAAGNTAPASASAPASQAAGPPAPAATTTAPPAPTKTEAPPTKQAPKTARVGDTVRAGDFEYTVHSVKCGIARVGTDFLGKDAQGTYCRVDLTAKNVTRKAQSFYADATLTAHDSAGREYDVDTTAGLYGNNNGKGLRSDVNPGNALRANVFFDVPKKTKLTKLVFDAGLFTFAEDAEVVL
ncbi:DUF4352 domain-containing protein [Micromonospora sp. NPDC005652]|uniref:DUF4352 domain-containing protein n=1 Tax=Micromonospora sp. NPDC005652 TaxID=3157046 RepID=UPI0033C1F5C5